MSAPRGGAFFRSMVLMGSSLALGCGGMTQDDGSGGTSGGGSGGGGSGGTANGSGGEPIGSGGAPPNTGGVIIIDPGTGGSTGGWGMGGFGGAYPTDCPTTQLTCPEDYFNCSYGSFDSYGLSVLPAGCECDLSRPASADDCGGGQEFVCLGARQSAEGELFDPAVAYSCACVNRLTQVSCNVLCDNHPDASSGYCYDPEESPIDLDAYLCGCAVTVLK